jgi:aspartate oxidase
VTELLSEHDLDLSRDLIPVAPVAHYFIGGVVTDVWGRTTVPGLYAAGEVASTGVHGANRLASNSLLEGLVFGDRVVRHLDRYIGRLGEDVRRLQFELPAPSRPTAQRSDIAAVRRAVTGLMSEKVGYVRAEDGLVDVLERLRATNSALRLGEAGPPEFELLNILTLATQITKCALLREETRGVHVRDDHPERDDYHWQRHITLRLPASPTTAGRP